MPQLLIGNSLRATARKFPDKTAFVFKDQRITYADFDDRVNRLANGLLGKGYESGDHIAILAFNCIEYYEILYALAKAGMTAAPVNFRFLGQEISYIVNHSDARALIYEVSFRETISEVRSEFEKVEADDFIVFGGEGDPGDTDYEAFIAASSPADPEIKVEETTTWYIGYTSGTTGRPKGAMRSHRGSVLLASNIDLAYENDVVLIVMPIFHSNSIWFGSMGVYYGCTNVIYHSEGFNPREILQIMQQEKVTFSSLVPTMYTMILQVPDKDTFDATSVRRLLVSSSPLMTKTKDQILAFFSNSELFEGYGATETGLVTCLRPEDQYHTVRSCGKVAPFVKIKVLNEQGNECAPGEVGELYAVTPSMFEGYYNQPEADTKAFLGEYASVGDMARVDEEGFYYIVDRKNDMIISGGENIYPSEIDDVLSKHPKIHQVAAIGIPHDKWGEAVKAVIVLKPGEEMTEAEVIAYSKENLAGYKCPKSVDFVDALPLNPTGKILKRELREKYWEGQEAKI